MIRKLILLNYSICLCTIFFGWAPKPSSTYVSASTVYPCHTSYIFFNGSHASYLLVLRGGHLPVPKKTGPVRQSKSMDRIRFQSDPVPFRSGVQKPEQVYPVPDRIQSGSVPRTGRTGSKEPVVSF